MNPVMENRPPQPFIAVEAEATHENLSEVIGGLFGEISGWIGSHGVAPVGPPFIRYVFVDDDEDGAPTRLQAGFPVAAGVAGGDRVISGMLPGGSFATIVHTGPWSGLQDATAALLAWGRNKEIQWAISNDGKEWAARLENYLTDPSEEVDPAKYRTELAFLTR